MSGDKLSYYFPGTQWSWPSENDYSTLQWFGPGDKPTEAELDALAWPPVLSLADSKTAKLAELAAVRWEREESGTTFGGNPLATDRTTQGKITAAYIDAKEDPTHVVPDWKFGPGVFGSLDAPTIIAAADAIKTHVQACFSHEAALSADIMAAADFDELSAIDLQAGWP